MNASLRMTVLALGLGISISTFSACSDKSASTPDVLAQDSSLTLAVMTANQDTTSGLESDTLATAAQPTPTYISTGTEEPASSVVHSRPSASAEPDRVSPGARTIVAPVRRDRYTTRVARTPRVATRHSNRSRVVAKANRSSAVKSNVAARRNRAASEGNSISGANGASADRMVAGNGVSAALPGRSISNNRGVMRSSAILPIGSELTFASDQRVCTNTVSVGDAFTTRLSEDVVGPLGVVLPKGTVAIGTISSIRNARKSSVADIGVNIESLTYAGKTYRLASEVTFTEVDKIRTRKKVGAGKVVAGAGIGAILGQVIGGDPTSTVIGAAGGAVAGGIVSSLSTRSEECVPNGGRITARLKEPLRVSLSE